MKPLCLLVLLAVQGSSQSGVDSTGEAGSQACAACHREISRRYASTGMAQSSGRIGEGTFKESFAHATFADARTGAVYRVAPADGGFRLGFSREETGVRGERVLSWFAGSGRVGRSYFFSLDGFLFQSPVSYYTQTAEWDVSPGFQRFARIYLTRDVEPGCLQCHASRLQPVAGTRNGYRNPPFLEGGVACERCHGPGKQHIASVRAGKGIGTIVNPAKLAGARRESVCAQCHLTGAARIARRRAKSDTFRPSELLGDYSAFFVWADSGAAMKVTSHFERLAQSRCKRASGDKMWCGSCHDVHGSVTQDAQSYRARCERCHAVSACKAPRENRAKLNDDCVSCHMPKSPVRDAEHSVYTDHSIPRIAGAPRRPTPEAGGELVPFWSQAPDPRDLGLAYAAVGDDDRAAPLLEAAQKRDSGDVAVLQQLAQIYDRRGETEQAVSLYQRILRMDQTEVAARVNLASIYARRGRSAEAIALWKAALARDPGLTGARSDLAVVEYRSGDRQAAEASLREALTMDPDDPTARRLLDEIRQR